MPRAQVYFIKTRKTAGSSTECALSALCGPNDILTPLYSIEKDRLGNVGAQNFKYIPPLFSGEWPNLISRFIRHGKAPLDYYNHMNAWRIKKRLGKTVWNSYFKFAFDRNPWDREISSHSQRLAQGRTKASFADHVMGLPKDKVLNFDTYTIHGNIAVDFLGRYENLAEDLQKVMTEIGVREKLKIPVTMNQFRTDRRSYREVYTPQLRDMIANVYRREIDLLGYEF